MAQNVQNFTLSLTLPITCHICLGKVRHPVICVNNHVFCSICIEVWLKNNSQCPACRIPITPENPCKEIIGGTSESEPIFSPAVRKHLRKTRLELLHKEYEDEIESLQKELEDLRGKNLSLEAQLKTVLDPLPLALPDKKEEGPPPADEEESRAGPETLEEWTKKLKATNEMYEKAKDDVEKLTEVNKHKLRLENGALVRENLRLKAEVDSRSPQKFGRFTVAALQSKLEQCERETSRLKKALERSDKYIEDLESQVSQLERTNEEAQNVSSVSKAALSADTKGSESSEEDNASSKSQAECLEKTTNPSPDDLEQPTDDGMLNNEVLAGVERCSDSVSQDCSNESVTHSPANKELFAGCQERLLDIDVENMDSCLKQEWDKMEDSAPYKDEELYDLPDPCTPSLSLSCLQLNTPDVKDGPLVKQESKRKSPTFLRKLEFEDFCDTSDDCNKDSPQHSASSCDSEKNLGHFTAAKPGFWNSCQTNYAENLDFEGSEPSVISSHSGEPSAKSSDKISSCVSKRLHNICSSEMNRTRTSSEASMDAAYLDKISELDSMMSESDNSKSPYYNFKSDLENPSKSVQCSELAEEENKKLEERSKQNTPKCPESDELSADENEWKSATFSILSPSGVDMNEHFPLFASQASGTNEIKPQNLLFQREFSQSFLFSNSQRLFEEHKFGSSLFKMSSEMQNLHNQLQSPWSSSFLPDKKNKSINQSTKRKIQSSLSSASPSKTTKN
uniref:ORC ubiquitin ligase 1 n=1 Tax=Sphenodon punctatus TaxID=8508 RepID=A0A8D0G6F8_SPHPU